MGQFLRLVLLGTSCSIVFCLRLITWSRRTPKYMDAVAYALTF
jgi:hypothetical protein